MTEPTDPQPEPQPEPEPDPEPASAEGTPEIRHGQPEPREA